MAMGSRADHLRGWSFSAREISAARREAQRRGRIDATSSPVTRRDASAGVLMHAADAALGGRLGITTVLAAPIDIGWPSRAFPVTPPGIRVRTTAVRLVKRVWVR